MVTRIARHTLWLAAPPIVLSALVAAACTVRPQTTTSTPSVSVNREAFWLDPTNPEWRKPAPPISHIRFETTKGVFVLELIREWGPIGADRFYNLARLGYYDDTRFHRVNPNYIAQWGLHGNPAVNAAWKDQYLQDDPPRSHNERGTFAFSFKAIPNTRNTQIYINLANNTRNDAEAFTMLGRVVEGMPVVDSLYSGYGENSGSGVRQGRQGPLETGGNAFMDREYPRLDRTRRVTVSTVAPPAPAPARADSVSARTIAPGVKYTRIVRAAGPWIVNVVQVDLRRPELALRHVRAHDSLRSRERVTDMVKRRESAGDTVLAAINADFFDLTSGANENNQLIDGEWWKGLKVTDSPFDTFDNVHSQFALDAMRHPLMDRFAFDGTARGRSVVIPVLALNSRPGSAIESVALFTPRFGSAAPRDTGRAVTEVALTMASRRGDTLVYVRRGAPSTTSGTPIPASGAVLAGYGDRAPMVASLADGDTVRITLGVTLGVTPSPARRPNAPPLSLIIGGWPRILRDGVNVAPRAASDEGAISRNADARHPRSAIGFSRDSTQLYLVTVDGRSPKSVGMTITELADLMRELGAWQALNFDGGGSTTLVIQDHIVNTPSDPAGERDVGNALLLTRHTPP